MKRSRACEDLTALEAQQAPLSPRFSPRGLTKRNKIDGLSDHAFAMLTGAAVAEHELSVLLELTVGSSSSHSYNRITTGLAGALDECLQLNRDTRASSVLEQDAREAKEAIQFKSSLRKQQQQLIDDSLVNSPDTPDEHILRSCYPRIEAFDMSSIIMVLDTPLQH